MRTSFLDYSIGYTDKKPPHWTAQRSIEIRGRDGEATLDLVGRLQAIGLGITSLEWRVSDERGEQARQDATIKALAALRNKQATNAAAALGMEMDRIQAVALNDPPGRCRWPPPPCRRQRHRGRDPARARTEEPRLMSADLSTHAEMFRALEGIPKVDFPSNLKEAVADDRSMLALLREVVSLRRGPGRLTPNEYFYYRLWESRFDAASKRRFVGKQAQQPMHIACNDTGWYATAADKLLFQSLMRGVNLPVPELLAVTQPKRTAADAPTIAGVRDLTRFLREPRNYPLFAKPIDGK